MTSFGEAAKSQLGTNYGSFPQLLGRLWQHAGSAATVRLL